MESNINNKENRIKLTNLDHLVTASSLAALITGASHGYFDARGIEFDKNSFAASSLYIPTLLMSGFTSLKSVMGEYPERLNKKPGYMGLIGGTQGAVITAACYGLGYAAGKII